MELFNNVFWGDPTPRIVSFVEYCFIKYCFICWNIRRETGPANAESEAQKYYDAVTYTVEPREGGGTIRVPTI